MNQNSKGVIADYSPGVALSSPNHDEVLAAMADMGIIGGTFHAVCRDANGVVEWEAEGKNALYTGLCDNFNQLLDTVSQTFREVRASAEQLSAASEQVSQTSQSLSHSASQQAAGVEETTANLHEISSSVRQNADSATVTDSIATQAAAQAGDMRSIEGRVQTLETLTADFKQDGDAILLLGSNLADTMPPSARAKSASKPKLPAARPADFKSSWKWST